MGQTGWWKRTKHSQVPPILTPSAARTRALGVRGFPVIYAHDGTGFMLRWLFAASTQKLVNITKACFLCFSRVTFLRVFASQRFTPGFSHEAGQTWLNPEVNSTRMPPRWKQVGGRLRLPWIQLGTKMHLMVYHMFTTILKRPELRGWNRFYIYFKIRIL